MTAAAGMSIWTPELCADVNKSMEGTSAAEIADWAVGAFGRSLAVAASMQDTILPHMFGERLPGVDVLFLETGYHFAETIATREKVAATLPVTIVNVMPRQSVAEQDAEFGAGLFARNPNTCCFLRKVDPLARALSGYSAWVTGARRVDAVTRAHMPVVAWDESHGLVKVNPIALWGDTEVEAYQVEYGLPRNPLVAQGYPSIGCAPCTRAVAPGEDARAGRWSESDKVECGIIE
jgi:phosphoadenosine phosphosulfate reductase